MSRERCIAPAQAAMTLVEVVVAASLIGLIVLGISTMNDRLQTSQRALAAKNDAESQGNAFFERVTGYFRTRMALRADKGYRIGACAEPAPTSRCLEIFRRKPDAPGGAERSERIVTKSACRAMAPRELNVIANLKITPRAVAESVKPLCGFVCPTGERPVVNVRRFADAAITSDFEDFVVPAVGRFNAAAAATAGFCVRARGVDEIHVAQGFAHFRKGSSWILGLVRKDGVLTTSDDNSKIEWLP